MQSAVIILFALFAAASAASHSNVVFNKGGSSVAYSINHRAAPHEPSTFVSVHRSSPAPAVHVPVEPVVVPVPVHTPVVHIQPHTAVHHVVVPAAVPAPALALPYGLNFPGAPHPYAFGPHPFGAGYPIYIA